jgi:hypothetical protein
MATSLEGHTAEQTAEAKSDLFERIGRSLDEWRARIDELVLQVDLANLDLRDELRRSVDVTQNAYLAAHAKLTDARADAISSLITLRRSLEKLLGDLGRTFEETHAAVRRAREK